MAISRLYGHILEIIRTLFRSYGNFPYHSHSFQIIRTHYLHIPDTLRIIRKLSRLTRHTPRLSRLCSDYPDTFSRLTGPFRIIWKLSRLSRHTSRSSRLFLDYPDTFSRLYGHFLDCPETFQFIQNSRHFAYYLDILYSIWTFSKISGNPSANNELVTKTFRICKNFPVSIADALTGFLRLCASPVVLCGWTPQTSGSLPAVRDVRECCDGPLHLFVCLFACPSCGLSL